MINSRRKQLEKDISTEQSLSKKNSRIQTKDENQIGTHDSQKKASQGKKAPERLRENPLDQSFPRPARIRSRADYLLTQREGRRFSGAHLILLCRENGLSLSRFGQTVSRKTGNAVRRNSIKRRLREAQRLNRHRIRSGFDIVVIARKKAGEASFRKLESEYVDLARQGGLMMESSAIETTDTEID
ncbi:ribonuclease P protein component [bacterium]|nr:MAG: ribonuclease P protein component [bacterium]